MEENSDKKNGNSIFRSVFYPNFSNLWINRFINGIRRLVFFYLFLCFALWFFEPQLLFPRWAIPSHDPLTVAPNWVEFQQETSKSEKIHGVLFAPPNQDYKSSKGTVVYFHGNAETVASCGDWANAFCYEHDVNLLVFDYPGYGKSTGSPSEKSLIRSADAAIDWFEKHTGQSINQTIFLGRSIGGAVAIPAATKHNPKALILERTFDSAITPAWNRFWFVPVPWLMTNTFRSDLRAPEYKGPVLQSHGTDDEIIPIDSGEILHLCFPGKKQFIPMSDVRHNGQSSHAFREARREFISGQFQK